MAVLHAPFRGIESRSIYSAEYSSPPPAQNAVVNNPTLLLSWWCTCFSIVIIIVRLCGRWIRTEKWFVEDKIMTLSIVPLLARMGCVHVVLRWGTNNTILDGLSADDIWHREIGSKCVLPARIFYAAFLWVAKLTIAEFLRRNFNSTWKRSWSRTLNVLRWFLALTFVGVVLATFTECRPTYMYWQVSPDPGPHCRQGLAQLITMGVCDVITDFVLVAFPIQIVFASKMRLARKISLSILFGLSFILVAITIYRVWAVIQSHSNQQLRSLIASLEILAATGVSNALVLGSFVRDRGAKKAKFKFGSVGGESSLDRPATARTRQHTRAALSWGSDVDLVSDIGMRLGPEFRGEKSRVARPAPAAFPASDAISPETQPFLGRHSVESDDSDPKSPKDTGNKGDSIELSRPSPLTPRRMSFFDVGGLLGEAPPPRRPSNASVTLPPDFVLSPHIRSPTGRIKSPRGRRGFFPDVGAILDSDRDHSRTVSQHGSRGHSRNPSNNRDRLSQRLSQDQNRD